MPTLTCRTAEYHSIDPETGKSIDVRRGEDVTVSDAKAKQMLRDFPDWFVEAAAKPKPARKKPAREDAAKPRA